MERAAAAVVATLWATGMRIGEAPALRWEDVDLEDGLVKVTSSKARTFRWAVLDRVAIERLQAWQGCDTNTGRVFPVNSRRSGTETWCAWLACRPMLCVEVMPSTGCARAARRPRSWSSVAGRTRRW